MHVFSNQTMDQANHPILPGTPEGLSVSPEEQEEKKNQELHLPGVGESGEPDHPGRNQDLLGGRAAADGTGCAASLPRTLLGFDDTDRPPPLHQRGGGGGGDDDDDDDDGDDNRGGECPICNERFGGSGERRLALLHCDHALCRHCLSRILKRARDPSRVQCPFCRQNTPVSRRDLVRMMMMLEEARDHDDDGGGGGGGVGAAAPEASYAYAASSYSSAPLLAGVQPQAPLGCLFAPGSEQVQQQQQLGVWGSGGGGGAGGAGAAGGGGDACASWVCPASAAEWLGVVKRPACCLPSTTVLLVMLLMLPWLFMSLRYL